jgi:uncharacterized protein YqeY
MTLKEQINKDYMTAFKNKDVVTKNLLSVVKGEIQTIEKNTGIDSLSDNDVNKILQKTSKSLKETLSVLENTTSELNDSQLQQVKSELSVISNYLPKEMSREEISLKIAQLKSEGITQIGLIMKEFNNLPADKKVVSEVLKENNI